MSQSLVILRGLALHHQTGLSSELDVQHNRTAAFVVVSQNARCDEVEAEERVLAESGVPEYPDLEPLFVKRKRVRMEEALQSHIHKAVGPTHITCGLDNDPYSDVRYDPSMYMDSTALL